MNKQNRVYKNQYNNFHIDTIKSHVNKDFLKQKKMNEKLEGEFQNVIQVGQKQIQMKKKNNR